MKGSKHILFISSWYPHPNNPTHGIFNRHFAEAAAKYATVSVLHVISDNNTSHSPAISEEHSPGIYTLRTSYQKVNGKIPLLSQWIKWKRMIAAYDRAFDRLVSQRGKPDLIQLNVAMPAGLGVLYLCKKHKIPFVLNEGWTGYMPQDGSYQGFFWKTFTQRIVRHAAIVMPVSESLQQAMQQQGLKASYRVVPNVVNTQRFQLAAPMAQKPFRWLHISTLDQRQKNVLGIIRAFNLASKSEPDLQLSLIGDGPDRPMLEAEVKHLQLEKKVLFKGVVLNDDVVREMQSHHALVMFSNYESFCVVIAEALACGKPILSSRCGGLTELITNDLGYTVDPGNTEALAESMLQMLNNYAKFDPAHLRKFVNDRFTESKIGNELNEVYQTVLNEKEWSGK